MKKLNEIKKKVSFFFLGLFNTIQFTSNCKDSNLVRIWLSTYRICIQNNVLIP